MAGIVPKKSSGRKQWTLNGSLKPLRNQLASDGCPESQVVLAKQLLDEPCKIESETKENARVGVYWLIKASQQGNVEATDMLRQCLHTGKGISPLNCLDVKLCIAMSQNEKVARQAAKKAFACLSNGGEFITSDQLQRKMLAIDKDHHASTTKREAVDGDLPPPSHRSDELMRGDESCSESDNDDDDDTSCDWSQRSDCSSTNEKLTEDDLVTAATDYSHGNLPYVNDNMLLCLCDDPDLKQLDNIILIHRSILHPWLALKLLYFKFMRLFSQRDLSLVIKSDLQFLGLLIIYAVFSSNVNCLYLCPMFLYYASFIVMIAMTFQMLQTKREFVYFRLWSGLFICYSDNNTLNAEQAENQYIRKNLRPYGNFFLALLINLIVYPIIVDQWIPQSELMLISFCLTFMTLLGFMPKRRSKIVFDLLIMFSFGVNVLAKYPYEIDPVVAQGWRFLDLKVPTFASFVIGNGIEFCINFRLLLYISILMILVKIASKRNWKGSYEMLIPHCVTLSWLQICIISSQGATMFGLLRGTLALVGVVLFLPLAGLTSIILPAAALTKWIITTNYIYNICVFLILSTILLGICWICAQTRFKKITAMIQLLSACIAIFILINNNNNNSTPLDDNIISGDDNNNNYYVNNNDNDYKYLSWDVFQRFCHQPVWQEENIAIAQLKCAELHSSLVHWNGYINDIKIQKISNFWQNLFDRFPNIIRQYFQCLYGDKITDNNNNECDNLLPDIVREDCMSFYRAIVSQNRCSLRKYNIYTFVITVRMHSGIWGKSPNDEVHVIVDDDVFANFTLSLKPNDHIWFRGSLFNNDVVGADGVLGGAKPHVYLEEIGCLACTNNRLSEIKVDSTTTSDDGFGGGLIRNVFDSFYVSFRFIVKFLFNPIVVFK